jgi:hypothetical protein
MKTHTWCRRFVSLFVVFACSIPVSIGAGSQNPAGLTISGVVLENDAKTAVPNMRLQLRNIDTGTIVGQTVSGPDGAYSFDVAQPGVYAVEAVDDRGVRAISKPTPASTSRAVVNVILPSTRSAIVPIAVYSILAAAAAAGALALAGAGAVSPER